MVDKILIMKLFNDKYGVCRLTKNESIPKWAQDNVLKII
ncbi:hypothetical protein [Clostridium saccharoperbutylacetonicum]